jgi:putative SbcD/Mre11-related phosphoesterase
MFIDYVNLTMEPIFDDRALIIHTDNRSILLISDLHLGFEEELSRQKGVSFPPQQERMIERVLELIEKYGIGQLYIVGDVKHTIAVDAPFNWRLIPEFLATISDVVEIHVIPGNHDGNLTPLLPRSVVLEDVHGILVGFESSIGLVHGHAWPSLEVLTADTIVIGHNHPTVRNVRVASAPEIGREDRKRFGDSIPVILQSKLDKNCARSWMGFPEIPEDANAMLVTLPSFNELFSGVPVNSPSSTFHGPLFENNCVDFSGSEVYSTSGQFIDTVKALRERFNEIIK